MNMWSDFARPATLTGFSSVANSPGHKMESASVRFDISSFAQVLKDDLSGAVTKGVDLNFLQQPSVLTVCQK
jgi:hypothetical protein